MRSTVVLLQSKQAPGTAQQTQSFVALTQIALVVVLIAAIGAIVFLLIRTGIRSGTLSKDERSWMDYGNL